MLEEISLIFGDPVGLTDIEHLVTGGIYDNDEEGQVESEICQKDAVRQEERVTTKVD